MSRPDADFRLFYETTAKEIYAFAYLVAGDKGEDFAAEAYSRALARWSDVSGYERPDAWVRRVIVNLLVSRARRERVQQLFVQRSRRETTANDHADQTEDKLLLQQALRQLSPKQRAVIVLRYWSDLSLKETARAMGCSMSSVNAHLGRARSKLESALGEAYVQDPAHTSSESRPQDPSTQRAHPGPDLS
ncbi:MAG: sigma-70 family RNA polymerase sigma factor [Actinobacteria bacterium]|nr:sigma-70 family RNA polymerase sigma factor [Actinomycetota bacterium]